MATLKTKICIRRDEQAKLAKLKPAQGELVYATDTKKVVIGDNTNTFANLPNIAASSSGTLIFIKGSNGSSNSNWIGETNEFVEIKPGLTIAYQIPGSGSSTQGIQLSVKFNHSNQGDNQTIVAPVYANNVQMTNELPIHTVVLLTLIRDPGQEEEVPDKQKKWRWSWAGVSSDAANEIRQLKGSYKFDINDKNKGLHFTQHGQTLISDTYLKTVKGEGDSTLLYNFDPYGPIYNVVSKPDNGTTLDPNNITLHTLVSLNLKDSTFTENKGVYLRCIPITDNNVKYEAFQVSVKESNIFTQKLEQENDKPNLCFLYLGQATNTVDHEDASGNKVRQEIELSFTHPLYTFIDGVLQLRPTTPRIDDKAYVKFDINVPKYDSATTATLDNTATINECDVKYIEVTDGSTPPKTTKKLVALVEKENLKNFYWADQRLDTKPQYQTTPIVKTVGFSNSQNAAGVTLQYNETDQCLEFIFK